MRWLRNAATMASLGTGLALVIAPPAVPKSWGSYSDWEVSDDQSSHRCFIGREHEGPGSTIFGISTDLDEGDTTIFILNDNWTVGNGDKIRLEIMFDGIKGYTYTGDGIGFTSDGKRGLAMRVNDPDFRRDFGVAGGLQLFKVDGEGDAAKYTVIDYLKLDGTGAAMAAFNRCLAHQRSVIAAERRERDRWKDIPEDPFSAKQD